MSVSDGGQTYTSTCHRGGGWANAISDYYIVRHTLDQHTLRQVEEGLQYLYGDTTTGSHHTGLGR